MADIATAIISGTFAIAGSLGSVWLKDRLERTRQVTPSASPPLVTQPISPDPALLRSSRRSSGRRPFYIALAGLAVGAVSSFLQNRSQGPSHPEAIASLVLLAIVTILAILYHAGRSPGRGLALFQFEMFSLWAAFACGWSLVHGSLWSDFIFAAVVAWLSSACAGLIFIPLIRHFASHPAKA